ncbi:MAG: amino acid ABC transporter permease [Rhodobiaceae bacterium]|nr:amino acid ABC transporter permease [Rhodobiaceae bacterium]
MGNGAAHRRRDWGRLLPDIDTGTVAEDDGPPFQSRWQRHWLTIKDWILFVIGGGLIVWGIVLGASGMGYNWQWYRVPRYLWRVVDGEVIWGPLMRGLFVTIDITLWAALVSFTLGLVVALMRLSRSYAGHAIATAYLEIVRNTPLLVQMYLFYFVLSPILGIDRFWTGVLAVSVFEASFISEIIRSGILSVERGQWEGAAALGLRLRQIYPKIVLPQAMPLMAPPMTSALVNLIKNSAIVSTIAIFDLTNEGRNVIADTFMSFEIWFTVAAIYLIMTISLSAVAARLEARARRGMSRA